jgi:hypothetical protein
MNFALDELLDRDARHLRAPLFQLDDLLHEVEDEPGRVRVGDLEAAHRAAHALFVSKWGKLEQRGSRTWRS